MSTTMPGFYTIDEAAEYLGIAGGGVSRYCRLGRIKAQRVGQAWLIKHDDLLAFKKKPRRAGNPNFGKK